MSSKSEDSFDYESSPESQTLLSDYTDLTLSKPSLLHTTTNHWHQCTCHHSTFTKWASILCAICMLINLILRFLPARKVACHDELASISWAQLNTLQRPSLYIGLDDISHEGMEISPTSIVNFLHAIAQVDRSHKSHIFDNDPLWYMSISGMVSLLKREVWMTNSVRDTYLNQHQVPLTHWHVCLDINHPPIQGYQLWNGALWAKDAVLLTKHAISICFVSP